MSAESMLGKVICETFLKECGKNQWSRFGPDLRRAFLIPFRLQVNHSQEEGYRYLDMVIWAPLNYVQVWTREHWDVIPREDLQYDEDTDEEYPKKGKSYQKGSKPWELISDHDSGWYDGVRRVVGSTRNSADQKGLIILGFSGPDWYKLVNPNTLELPLNERKVSP